MDEDVGDEDRDEDGDVRGRRFSKKVGTSEDEYGEDFDVLRRPGLPSINNIDLVIEQFGNKTYFERPNGKKVMKNMTGYC